MTRLLVLGAAGMLGHKLFQRASLEVETVGALRRWNPRWGELGILDPTRIVEFDAGRFDQVERVILEVEPTWVVNCVGIVKQRREAADERLSNLINSELPVFLGGLGRRLGVRVVHVSTDCVFSGTKGGYTEQDTPDPVDLYGESKHRGEAAASHAIVLRTSLIGREIANGSSLVEWFLRRAGSAARGYTRAIFSGLTTIAAADEIIRLVRSNSAISGLYHVSADAIEKHQLLLRLRDAFARTIEITPDDSIRIDRSLDSTRYRAATGYSPPSWRTLIAGMASDPTPYDELKL